jgi:hypothetical protein
LSRCLHNAQVARGKNRHDLARMWTLFEHLLTPMSQPQEEIKQEEIPLNTSNIIRVVDDEDALSSFDDLNAFDEKSYEDDIHVSSTGSSYPGDQVIFNSSYVIPTSPSGENYSPPPTVIHNPSFSPHGSFLLSSPAHSSQMVNDIDVKVKLQTTNVDIAPPIMIFYDDDMDEKMQGTDGVFNDVLADTLDYYSELGDAQTCASIVAVVGSAGIEHERVLHWYLAYVELLSRHKAFSLMNELIQSCEEPYIRSLNKQSTSIKTCCGKCGTIMGTRSGEEGSERIVSSTVCEKCASQTARCAICRLPVQGAFFWCQKCGHGGHLNHMMNWFKKYGSCPVCGVDVANVQKM